MRILTLSAATALAVSSAALAAPTAANQASGGSQAAAAEQAPIPPCEYKTRMNFKIGEGTTGALHARVARLKDVADTTTELRLTIEAPIAKAHSSQAESMVKVTLGMAKGYLEPLEEGANARRQGLQWVHVRSRQLEGTSPSHPAYKIKPKPGVRWTVGGKTLTGEGVSPEGGALFILDPAVSDEAPAGDPADLFTGGDWTFETSKSFDNPWADYTIPGTFLSGIVNDMSNLMASLEKAAANGECTIGTSFGEMGMQDITYF